MANEFSDNITVQISKFGKGLFANKYFPKGSIIFQFTGNIISFADTISLGDIESHPLQIGDKLYLHPDEPLNFINHSCDPNCGIIKELQVISLKEIEKGQEFFFDYSTTMFERHWTMKCECDSPLCRQLILDFDQLPKKIQEKYIKLDIVQPFIKRHYNDTINQNHDNKYTNGRYNNSW